MATQKPLVTIIIPNLNGMKFLRDCLASLGDQSYRNFETIVVDNGSTDGSVAFIENNFPDVIIIKNSVNTGFAAANNQGIRNARGAYIAALNNDTKADTEWLMHLVNAAESSGEDVGMWAPKVLSMERPDVIDSVGGLVLYRDGVAKGRGRIEKDIGQYDGLRDVLCPSACSALYRKDMLLEIGLFDEDFFAYCEDTDLGLRAVRAGWKAVSVPEAVIYHHYSGTGGMYSDTKVFLVARNHLWAAWKNFPLSWLLMLPYYTSLRYILQFYGALAGRGGSAKFMQSHTTGRTITTLIKSFLSAVRGLPCILKKRKQIIDKISQREYIRLLKKHGISAGRISLVD